MKITVRVNDVNQHINVPVSWDQVTYKQFLQLAKAGNSYAKVLSVLTGIDEGVITRAQIKNLDAAMQILSFIRKPCPYFVPHKILFYPLPKDLGFESVAQYEDIRSTLEKLKDATEDQRLNQYPYFVAVYACRHMSKERCEDLREATGNNEIKFGEYHYLKAEAMAEDFFNCPAPEVLGIGNFTLLKYVSLNLGINPVYQMRLTPMKRLRLVFKRWLLSLDLPERLATWKKRLAFQVKS